MEVAKRGLERFVPAESDGANLFAERSAGR
jgi:hypothetical protein